MSGDESGMTGLETPTGSQAPERTLVALRVAAAALVLAAGLLFLLARRLEWTPGWTYVGLCVATVLINLACILRWNPVLIKRRSRMGKGTKGWDIVWMLLFGPLVIAVFVVADQDPSAGPTAGPGPAWLLGLILFILGWALAIWSMAVNPFFEKTVRIQEEQGHRVIDTGPYAYVRHPGYVGFSAWLISTPLLLASTDAFVPAVLSVLALVIRTALEDRTLQAELPGYAEFATRVRFRLIPGIW